MNGWVNMGMRRKWRSHSRIFAACETPSVPFLALGTIKAEAGADNVRYEARGALTAHSC